MNSGRVLTSLFVTATVVLAGTGSAVAADEAFNKKMDAFLADDENIEKIGGALERYFKKKQQKQQKDQAAAQQKQLEEQFKNPVKIAAGNSPVKGPKNAKVTVIEFSDFQCPYCSRGRQVMEDLLKEYPKDVRVVFKNLPLPFHGDAKPAAIAALAAGRQNKFWEYHDVLFENQRALKEANLLSYAEKLGLDMAKFKKDIKDPALAKQVDDDMALASKHGVQGTPGFFVNGVQVRGARPLPYFKQLVDRWLEQLAKK